MTNFYNVFEDGKYVTVVKAVSAEDACKQVRMERRGKGNYTAERVRLT